MHEEEHPSFHAGLISDHSNGRGSPLCRYPEQAHCCQSLSWHRTRIHGMRRQSRGLTYTQESPLWGQKLGRLLGGICPGPSYHRGGGTPGGEPVPGHTGQSHSWHQGSPLPAQCFSPAGAPTSSPPCPCPPQGLLSQHRCLIIRIWAAPGGLSSNFLSWEREASNYRGLAEQRVAFQVALVIKNMSFSAGDTKDAGLIPGSGRFHGRGHGKLL